MNIEINPTVIVLISMAMFTVVYYLKTLNNKY